MQTSSSYSSKCCLWTFNRALKLNQALKNTDQQEKKKKWAQRNWSGLTQHTQNICKGTNKKKGDVELHWKDWVSKEAINANEVQHLADGHIALWSGQEHERNCHLKFVTTLSLEYIIIIIISRDAAQPRPLCVCLDTVIKACRPLCMHVWVGGRLSGWVSVLHALQ